MKTIHVSGKFGDFKLNLPTKIDEITSEYLEVVTSDIVVAPNYVLVGLIYVDKLTYIMNTNKKSANKQISCVPVFVKAGTTESEYIKDIKVNTKLIVAGSDLAIGHHVASPHNKLTIDNIVRLMSQDADAMMKLWQGDDAVCYFVEFKIIPASAIHGVILNNNNADIIQPYVVEEATNVVE